MVNDTFYGRFGVGHDISKEIALMIKNNKFKEWQNRFEYIVRLKSQGIDNIKNVVCLLIVNGRM